MSAFTGTNGFLWNIHLQSASTYYTSIQKNQGYSPKMQIRLVRLMWPISFELFSYWVSTYQVSSSSTQKCSIYDNFKKFSIGNFLVGGVGWHPFLDASSHLNKRVSVRRSVTLCKNRRKCRDAGWGRILCRVYGLVRCTSHLFKYKRVRPLVGPWVCGSVMLSWKSVHKVFVNV